MNRNLKRRRRSSASSQGDEDRACAEKRGRHEEGTIQSLENTEVTSAFKLFDILKIDSETECGPSLASLYAEQEDFLVQEIIHSNVADEEVVVTSECDCGSCTEDNSELTEILSPHFNGSSEGDSRVEASETDYLDPTFSCQEIIVHSENASSPVAESMIDSDLENDDSDVERDQSDDDLDGAEYAANRRGVKATSRAVTFMGQLTPGSSTGPGSSRKCCSFDSPVKPYATQSRCPVPQLWWADREKFWEVMCRKDEDSLKDRNPDLFTYQPNLKPRMRVILLDWLSEVASVFHLHRETYYLTIDYLDRYLTCTSNIPKQQLQLIGITCLYVASKVEEIYPPKIKDFANVTDSACSKEEIFQMEVTILRHLNWLLTPITVNNWLEMMLQFICQKLKKEKHNLFTCQFSSSLFKKLCHLLDLATLDITSLRFSYCVLAATAIYTLVDPDLAISISGLKKEALEPCVQWMSVYWKVLRETKKFEKDNVEDLLDDKKDLSFGNKSSELQEHTISLDTYELVQTEFELMASQKNMEADSSRMLTPPSSSSKSST